MVLNNLLNYLDINNLIALVRYTKEQKNNLSAGVNITSYNSTSNMYTFPEDGYVELHRSGSQSGSITAFVYGATGNSNLITSGVDSSAYQTIYVRKCMRCRISSTNASYHVATYYAFTD